MASVARTWWLVPLTTLVALSAGACARPSPPPLWQAVEVATDADFVGVWFSDSLNGWLTGGGWDIDGGIVGRTRDGGRSWRFQSGIVNGGGTGFALGRVQFFDSLRGCAVGRYGRVMLTQDGGELWRRVGHSGAPELDLIGVQFLDERTGWAVGSGGIIHTEDGGETWDVITRSRAENVYLSGNAIHFVDAQRGWLTSHSSGLMVSDDGGRNWSPVPLTFRSGERPTLRDVTFIGDDGWVVGELGSIFHTADGGASWTRQESGVPVVRVIPKGEPPRPREVVPELEAPPDRLALTAVRFADANRGWTLGHYADVAESIVLGTRDGGATWAVEHIQPGERLHSLYVLDTEHAWAAGDRERTQPQVVLRFRSGAR